MSLTLQQKQAVVSEVREVAATAQAAVAAEYIGLTVAQMTQLRTKARSSGVYLRVVKNTLARRAVDGTSFECLKDSLTGPLLLVFSLEDPGAGARLVRDFAKDNPALVIKGGVMEGTVLDASGVAKLADLESREVLLAKAAGVLKAVMYQAAYVINAPASKAVRTVDALRAKQEEAAA